MVEGSSGKILKASEDSVIALGDEGREGTGGRILPVYSMGCGAGRAYLIAGEETGHRAYIGISDEGKIGDEVEGKSIYHTMLGADITS